MVRKSPSKTAKRTQSASARKPAALAATSLGSFDPDSAPRLDPQDDHGNEPWSPTRSGLRSPTKPLSQQLTSLQQEKDAIDSKLWEATVELQEKVSQKKLDDALIAKLQSELSKIRSDNENDTQKLNSFEDNESQLKSALLDAQKQAAQEKRSALEKLENRDDFIEKLQTQLESLRTEITSLRERALPTTNEDALPSGDRSLTSEDSHFLNGDTTTEQSFNSASFPQTPGSNELLSSLGRHKRQLKAQRNILNKQRAEILDLRKKLSKNGEVPLTTGWDSLTEDGLSDATVEYESPELNLEPQSLLQDLGEQNAVGFSLGDDLLTGNLDSQVSGDQPIPPLLLSQAHAFNHKLIPMEEYEHLSKLDTNSSRSMGFEDLKRLAANLNYSILPNAEFENLNKLLHGGKPATLGHHSHVLQDLVSNNVMDSLSLSKNQAAWAASRDAPQTLRDYVGDNNLALIPNSISAFAEILDKAGFQIVFSPESSSGNSRSPSSSPDRRTGVLNPKAITGPAITRELSLDSLTRDELASAAASQGLAVLPVKQIEALQNRWKLFKETEIPTAAEVAQIAKRAGLMVLPEDPTLDELNHVVKDDMIVVDRQDYEALEAPGPATLRRLARLHDLSVVPRAELDQLREQQSNRGGKQQTPPTESSAESQDPLDISVDSLRRVAEKNNMIVLSASDYQQMLKSRPTRDFSNLPMSQRTQYYEQLIDQQKKTSPRQSPNNSSLGSMEDRAKRMGRLLITHEEYQQLQQSQKIYEPTKADIIQSAKALGLATMPLDEFAALRSRKWKDNSKDKGVSSPQSAHRRSSSVLPQEEETGELKVIPANYLATLQRIAESPTESDLRSMAKKLNFSVAPSELDETYVLQRIKELGISNCFEDEEILEKALHLGLVRPYTDEEIIQRATKLGMCFPLTEEEIISKANDMGLVKALSEADIIFKANQLGLATPLTEEEILAKAETLGHINPTDESRIIEKAKTLGLDTPLDDAAMELKAFSMGFTKPLTDQEIETRAKALGLDYPLADDALTEKAKGLGLIEPTDKQLISQKAREFGLVEPLSDEKITSHARTLGLADPLTEEEILIKGRSLGLISPLEDAEIISRAQALGLSHPPAQSDILSSAKSLGLVDPPTDDEILNKARALGLTSPLSKEDIISEALSLGLKHPLSENEILSKAKSLGLVEALTDDEVVGKAKALGLVQPLSEEEIVSKASSLGLKHPPTEAEVLADAKALGLIDPLSKDEILSKARSLGLQDPISKEDIVAKARTLGLVDPLHDDEIKSKAMGLGLINPLGNEDIVSKAKELGLEYPLSDADIVLKSRSLGLVDPPSDEEIVAKAKNLGLAKPLDDEGVILAATQLGLSRPPTETEIVEKGRSLGLTDPPSDDDIKDRAKALGFTKPLENEEIVAKAKTLGLVSPPTDQEILEKATLLGYSPPLDEREIVSKAKTLGLIHPLTEQDILSQAKSFGLIDPPSRDEILAQAQAMGLEYPLSEETILDKASMKGMKPPLTNDEIVERAAELGMILPPSQEDLVVMAKSLGVQGLFEEREIMGSARSLGLQDPLNDEEISERARDLGFIGESEALDEAARLGWAPAPGKKDIIAQAKKMGLLEPRSEEFYQEAKHVGLQSMTPDHVRSLALDLGMIEKPNKEQIKQMAVDANLVISTPQASIGRDFAAPSSVHDVPLVDRNRDSRGDMPGISTISTLSVDPEEDESDWRAGAHSEEAALAPIANLAVDDHEVILSHEDPAEDVDVFVTSNRPSASAAATIFPRRLVPTTETQIDSGSTATAPTAPSAVDEALLSKKVTGTPVSTGDRASVPMTATSPTFGGPPSRPVSDTPLRKTTHYEVRGIKSPWKSNPPISSPKFARKSVPPKATIGTPSSARNSLSSFTRDRPQTAVRSGQNSFRTYTGLSQQTGSARSIETLTASEMEHLLSQVMMGEVLYKYYGGMNFEGITGGRHKRYFWFRPESRTLYWNRENPSVLGPGVVKSITLIGVDEVIDRNPLPSGLYHRSLVFKGRERELCVTCHTQNRHAVWLAALRYALSPERSIHSQRGEPTLSMS